MNARTTTSLSAFLLALLLVAAPGQAQYRLARSVFGSGGARLGDANSAVAFTLGQTAAGVAASTTQLGRFGFWYTVGQIPVGTGRLPAAPAAFLDNYPNPFRISTTIRFHLPQAAAVTLSLADLSGRELITVASGRYPAGSNEVALASEHLVPGMYLLVLRSGDGSAVRKMILLE